MSTHRVCGRGKAFAGAWLIVLACGGVLRAGAAAGQELPARAADLSGVERFLALTAILEKDQEPPPELWDALFATPGYAVLLRREFQKDFFAERFRTAFMPSRAEALKEQMKKEAGTRVQYLEHYLRARSLRGVIERWLAELKPAELYAQAMDRAQALLPEGAASGLPNVSFVVFAPDARGYDPVVLDVLFCMDQGSRLVDVVGHEFHHFFRNRLVDLTQDQSTLWMINQIHGEGVADLISKADWLRKPEAELGPREKDFLKLYRDSPAVLRSIDALFTRMSGMATGRSEPGNELRRAVPQVGHPTGLYMATLILEEMGGTAVAGVAVDPFGFFRLYQEAAIKRGGETVRFSEESMAFLARLARCR